MTYEQQTLDLEYPVTSHYTVELRKGAVGNMGTEKSMQATSLDGAIGLIDGFREWAEGRHQVTWRADEPDQSGSLMGLAPGGVVWEIHCNPDLNTPLG